MAQPFRKSLADGILFVCCLFCLFVCLFNCLFIVVFCCCCLFGVFLCMGVAYVDCYCFLIGCYLFCGYYYYYCCCCCCCCCCCYYYYLNIYFSLSLKDGCFDVFLISFYIQTDHKGNIRCISFFYLVGLRWKKLFSFLFLFFFFLSFSLFVFYLFLTLCFIWTGQRQINLLISVNVKEHMLWTRHICVRHSVHINCIQALRTIPFKLRLLKTEA